MILLIFNKQNIESLNLGINKVKDISKFDTLKPKNMKIISLIFGVQISLCKQQVDWRKWYFYLKINIGVKQT